MPTHFPFSPSLVNDRERVKRPDATRGFGNSARLRVVRWSAGVGNGLTKDGKSYCHGRGIEHSQIRVRAD
jgi:hypothetical protein